MTSPATGRQYNTHGCAPRNAVTSWTPKWNSVPITPQTTPIAAASTVHFKSVQQYSPQRRRAVRVIPLFMVLSPQHILTSRRGCHASVSLALAAPEATVVIIVKDLLNFKQK